MKKSIRNTILLASRTDSLCFFSFSGQQYNNIHSGSDNKRIFGGGRAGDVVDANINYKNTVTNRLGALYGGCLASNLTGTATMTIGESSAATFQIDTIYGGNDYSGLTQNTDITVNGGTFIHVFGAGNGDYTYSDGCANALPYSMGINITYNNGTFNDNVYGGGNMGLVGDRNITSTNFPSGTSNSNLYGNINVNIKGGHFKRHVFLGAKGSLTKRKSAFGFSPSDNHTSGVPVVMLAYAYKQLNMDGGQVDLSIYGGSEAVDDGYPYECYGSATDQTTLRPSSVLNIVGGTIENRLYGGGYRGNVYGSIYVNVGEQAVNDCPVWTKNYGGSAFNDNKMVALLLQPSNLYLNSSIYNGSDWGEAGENQYFTTRGFYGGEGIISIDGEGYQTSLTIPSTNPNMNIAQSIIGSGTSTAPADVKSEIIIRHYGDYYCPTPSKQLMSIQRTNRLYLDNSNFILSGEQDAYSSYASPSYSLCRIDEVILHDANVIETMAPSIYIGKLRSEMADKSLYSRSNLWGVANVRDCSSADDENFCQIVYAGVTSRNVLLLENGSYISVSPFVDELNNQTKAAGHDFKDDPNHSYGSVEGYMFIVAPNNTKAYAYARPNTDDGANDGGFVSPCSGSNTLTTSTGTGEEKEVEYVVVSGSQVPVSYRSWGVGTADGNRTRHITLVAHVKPEKVIGDEQIYSKYASGTTLAANDKYYTKTDNSYEEHVVGQDGYTIPSEGDYFKKEKYAYATATLQLPPSDGKNFYTISSVSIDDDNGNQVRLTDNVYNPYQTTPGWYTSYGNAQHQDQSQTEAQFDADPNYTFGLMLHLKDNFSEDLTTNVPSSDDPRVHMSSTVISGNSYLTTMGGFNSGFVVDGAVGVLPTIDFALTYRTDLTTTVTRDVVFTMLEKKYNGNTGDIETVGPVQVTVTISTVISDFADLEAPLLAMYNEGVNDTYVRKVVVPASYVQRSLYLDKVVWYPETGNDSIYNIQSTSVGKPTDYTHFSIEVTPTEDVTQNISNSLGWYSINSEARGMDLYQLGTASTTGSATSCTTAFSEPKLIGILDGRAAAAINITLNYNGNLVYEDKNPLGNAVLYFRAVNTQNNSTTTEFQCRITVRTRVAGDTIFLAEPAHMYMYEDGSVDTTGSGTPLVTLNRYDELSNYKKNDPVQYLGSFDRAFEVYDEGDVIAILNPIHISNTEHPVNMRGSKYGTVNIIRYTGSHYRWPGTYGTYRGPLVVVKDGASFSVANARFNGMGVGRTMIAADWQSTDQTCLTGHDHASGMVVLNLVTDPSTPDTRTKKTFKYHKTEHKITYSNAPIIWVEEGGQLQLAGNVELINNFNQYDALSTTSVAAGDVVMAGDRHPGGGIGIVKNTTNTRNKSAMLVGNNISITQNIIINHSSSDHGVGNYGAGIYVDGAKVQLSTRTTNVKNLVTIAQNYYLPSDHPTTTFFDDNAVTINKPDGTRWTQHRYSLKPISVDLSTNSGMRNSNVYLTRTKPTTQITGETTADFNQRQVETDAQSDLITVESELNSNSKIGFSKWFPGFKARDTYGRDTIAVVYYPVSNPMAATNNFASTVFVDDSATYDTYYREKYRTYPNPSGQGVLGLDIVDVRHSSLLNSGKIYLHRCASFVEDANPIEWVVNHAVVCPGDGDMIKYNVKGGAALYTYTWMTSPTGGDDNTYTTLATTSTNSYVPLSLSIPANDVWKEYHLMVTAQEAGGCQQSRKFDLLVKQVGSDMSSDASAATCDDYIGGRYFTEGTTEPIGRFQSTPVDRFMRYNEEQGYSLHTYKAPDMDVNNNTNPSKVVRFYSYYKNTWGVNNNEGQIAATDEHNNEVLSGGKFCPGDVIHLSVTPNSGKEFMMWDVDPSAPAAYTHVVNKDKEAITAYMAPNDYWVDVVHVMPDENHFEVDYNGNVTIKSENGLAWLISTINGLNHEQARTYAFNTITIMPKSGGYDMKAHKWTPMGNIRLPFRGEFLTESAEGRSADISGIIVNEPELQYVGFFGNTDSARITGVAIKESVIKGNAFGGGMIGYAGPNTELASSTVDATTTVCAANAVGGIAGKTLDAKITSSTSNAKFVGSTLYGGGIAGMATITTQLNDEGGIDGVSNNTVNVNSQNLAALYYGGLFGSAVGAPAQTGSSPAFGFYNTYDVDGQGLLKASNNYVHLTTGNQSYHVGGIAGYAQNAEFQNNYAYGQIKAISSEGAIVGRAASNVNAENCFYEEGAATSMTGAGQLGYTANLTQFSGAGNQVLTADSVDGLNNLTRVLNSWVRRHEGYSTWRSDLEGENSGYPIFGHPDQIPVYDTISEVVCDSMNLDGFIITENGVYTTIFSDTVNYVDSVLTINLTVNHSDTTLLADVIHKGEGYVGNGFVLTAEQIEALASQQAPNSIKVLQFVDSLLTEQGCDSLVVLNLTIYNSSLDAPESDKFSVEVYPNPTVGRVSVDAEGLESVEVFDALSRRLLEVVGKDDHAEFNLENNASGSYYLRITTTHGVAVRKVVKK